MFFNFRATTRLVRRRNNFSSLTTSRSRQRLTQRMSTPSLRTQPSIRTISSGRASWSQASPQSPVQAPHNTLAEASTVAPPPRIINPKRDEDGNEMVITATPRAIKRLREITASDPSPNLGLRITVESGGCHGFQYLMSLSDKIDPEEDTIFDHGDGARVICDEPSLELLKGSKVDYTMELIGSQFKIVGNPRAESSCGCGTSFDIKF